MNGIAAQPTRTGGLRGWKVWALASAVAVLAVGGLSVTTGWTGRAEPLTAGSKFYTVSPVDLDVRVVKDGELQAVNNIDIICKVEGASTIVQIVKEGTEVKKGDLLVELDSSEIRTKIEDVALEEQNADA